MEENADKLSLCTDFNSSTPVSVYAKCIYVRHNRGEMYIGHDRLCVCVCVCVCASRPIHTLVHVPGCNLQEIAGVPSSCALLGGLAIVHGFRCSKIGWRGSVTVERRTCDQ